VWREVAVLAAFDADHGGQFGSAVAADGDTVVVGALSSMDFGAAYVFVREEGLWVQQARLSPADAAESDLFGHSVAVSGDVVVVGAIFDDHGGQTNPGSAYVFTRSDGTWQEEGKLTASDAGPWDQFGYAVAATDDRVAVGAIYDDNDAGADAGAVYVFHRGADGWAEEAKLATNDLAYRDFLGGSVALDDRTVVAGAYRDDDAGDASGAAYVFQHDGDTWQQVVKLTASDAGTQDWFGRSVAIQGDSALIGAPLDDHDAGTNAGSAYLFVRRDGAWHDHAKLTGSTSAESDWFGLSVDIHDGLAVSGAHSHDHPHESAGATYLFDLNLNSTPEATPDSYDLADMQLSLGPAGFLVSSPGVLDNDVDADGDQLTAELATAPTRGTVRLRHDGAFVYTPSIGFTGTDTFSYVANDGAATSQPVTVTITLP
jgi:hypothetical protein